jgi:hypothetical protein
MGFYGNSPRPTDVGLPEWNPTYFVDYAQGKKELRGYEGEYKGGRPPLRVHSTSPDPVAIAVNGEELQPDQHSPETQEKFNHWFNHAWDSIYKPPTDESWLTAKFSLTPSQIWEKWQNPNELIGLRFGVNTRYGLIDIDYGSKYHSDDGLRAIKGVLETIGINKTNLIRSSFSEGWHLYYFLPEAVGTFRLAQAVAIALRENGLELEAGQLEIFPNVKSFVKNGFSHYNGHRLPLQPGSGSDLLNKDFEPYSNSIDTFLSQAEQAALSVDFDVLRVALETAGDRYKELFKRASSDNVALSFKWIPHSKNAKRWKKESEKWIETGWTGQSQSNYLLGIIAEYGRVFLGIDNQSELAAYIFKTAIACPGYYEFCRHQHEIEAWCQRWAKCAMLHRFPYGSRKGKFKLLSKGGLNNEEKKVEAMTRISEHFEDLLQSNHFPKGISALRSCLAKLAHCSERTLAKKDYLPLWHPKYRNLDTVKDSEFRSHADTNCVVPSVVAGEVENNLLILPTEGSDRIIGKIQSLEINQNNSQTISFFLSSEINFARFSTLKTPETLDMQAFKARKDTAKLNTSIINNSEKGDCFVSPKTEALKIGDRVYHVDRPSYFLTITQIVNDELVKAVTNGFKGAEYFPIIELMVQLPTDGCSQTKGRSPLASFS